MFLLWGKYAQQKAKMVDSTKHCILTSARYFFGNQYLQQVVNRLFIGLVYESSIYLDFNNYIII